MSPLPCFMAISDFVLKLYTQNAVFSFGVKLENILFETPKFETFSKFWFRMTNCAFCIIAAQL